MTPASDPESRSLPFLKSCDPRTKILCTIILTVAAGLSKPLSLAFLSFTGFFGMLKSSAAVSLHSGKLKGLLILALLIPVFKFISSPVQESLTSGLVLSLKLVTFISLGTALSLNTTSTEIGNAVVKVLSFFPFVKAGRIGTQIGLSVRGITIVLEETERVKEAQISRLADQRRNPVSKIARLTVPVFIRIFTRAKELSEAMESRNYSDDRTLPELYFSRNDTFLFLFTLLAAAGCFFLNRVF